MGWRVRRRWGGGSRGKGEEGSMWGGGGRKRVARVEGGKGGSGW